LGGEVVPLDEREHLGREIVGPGELPVLERRRVRIEKKISTWLSQEACLGANTSCQRGCSANLAEPDT